MIREATLSDVAEYFSERGLEIPDALNCDSFIVDESMLVVYLDVEPLICEVHICVRKRFVRYASRLIEEGERYLRLKGYDAMTTAIEPQYRPSIKLVERIGFNRIGCYNNHIIFCKEL